MTAMLWVYGIAAATALALAEHWLRYALVERKRARRVAARLERIRRGRERREREADDREWAAYLARKAEPRLADSLYAQMQAEQMRAMQGVSSGAQAAQQNMAMGLDPAEQNGGAGAQWPNYVADLSAGPVRHVSTSAECRCIFCQRTTGRFETGTGPFPAPDTWRDPLLDGPRGVTARGAQHGQAGEFPSYEDLVSRQLAALRRTRP